MRSIFFALSLSLTSCGTYDSESTNTNIEMDHYVVYTSQKIVETDEIKYLNKALPDGLALCFGDLLENELKLQSGFSHYIGPKGRKAVWIGKRAKSDHFGLYNCSDKRVKIAHEVKFDQAGGQGTWSEKKELTIDNYPVGFYKKSATDRGTLYEFSICTKEYMKNCTLKVNETKLSIDIHPET